MKDKYCDDCQSATRTCLQCGNCSCDGYPCEHQRNAELKLKGVDEHQPAPIKNTRPAIQDLVVRDIEARKEIGLQRYGTLLQGFNGRDCLLDAYQEAIDLVIYLRQAIYERDCSR